MKLSEENETIIDELQKQIEKFQISEIEETIKAKEDFNISYNEKIYDASNELRRMQNRIFSVNQRIFNEFE